MSSIGLKFLLTGYIVLVIAWAMYVVQEHGWLALLKALVLAFGIVIVFFMLVVGLVYARDLGQWDRSTPEAQWYATLMQPDNPAVSCCGEADAYWCDILRTEVVGDGKARNFCTITDDRDDEPRKRPHIDIGTEIEIPDNKMKGDQGNPTGHAIVFVSTKLYVFCFVMGSGI